MRSELEIDLSGFTVAAIVWTEHSERLRFFTQNECPSLHTAGHNARIVASEFSQRSKRHVFTHVCLDSSTPHRDSEAPAIFKGRWSKKLQYKREASCVTRNSLRMKDVIVLFMLMKNMRLQVSHLAVCTDVSELGSGLCYSTGLTRCGGVQACALAWGRECDMAKPW